MTVNSKVRVAKVRSEETSPEVASLAGRILATLAMVGAPGDRNLYASRFSFDRVCTVAELRSLAASVLTQAPDRKGKS